MPDSPQSLVEKGGNSAWDIAKLLCCGVVVLSVLSCFVIAAARSTGLTRVKVTALIADDEPRDHEIPLFKQKEALPDYEIKIRLKSGQSVALGAKPNTSAIGGLVWMLSEPISVSEVAGVRLQEQDTLLSDAIAETQISDGTITIDNYEFEFTTERSLIVGVQYFFRTPIGLAISGAFVIAVLLMLVSIIAM